MFLVTLAIRRHAIQQEPHTQPACPVTSGTAGAKGPDMATHKTAARR